MDQAKIVSLKVISNFYFRRASWVAKLRQSIFPEERSRKKGYQGETFDKCVIENEHNDCTFVQNVTTHLSQIGFFCGHDKVIYSLAKYFQMK